MPGSLCRPPVARDLLGAACVSPVLKKSAALPPRHAASWWAAMTAGMDFSHPDAIDPNRFNEILQYGVLGEKLLPRTQ